MKRFLAQELEGFLKGLLTKCHMKVAQAQEYHENISFENSEIFFKIIFLFFKIIFLNILKLNIYQNISIIIIKVPYKEIFLRSYIFLWNFYFPYKTSFPKEQGGAGVRRDLVRMVKYDSIKRQLNKTLFWRRS